MIFIFQKHLFHSHFKDTPNANMELVSQMDPKSTVFPSLSSLRESVLYTKKRVINK